MPKAEFVPVVEVPLIAVTEELFGGKGGQSDTTMYRLYMADAKGHIGISTAATHAAGELVRLGLWSVTARCGWAGKVTRHSPISNRANVVYHLYHNEPRKNKIQKASRGKSGRGLQL